MVKISKKKEPVNDKCSQDENSKLIEVIKAAVPEGAVPLFISIIGSRAKGLETNESGYEVVVIVKYKYPSED